MVEHGCRRFAEGRGGVTAAVRDNGEAAPRALRAVDGRLEIGVVPGESGLAHHLAPGDGRAFSAWIRHHAAGAEDVGQRARSFLSPLRFEESIEAPSGVGMMSAAGIVAAYGFDEGAGPTVGDSSGKGNTGTLVNSTAFSGDVPAAIGGGTSLTFSGGTNDHVLVPHSTTLDVTNSPR